MYKLLNRHNLLRYIVAAILLSVPLYPKFPFIRVPGTYVSIRLEDFVVFLGVMAWIVHILPNLSSFLKNKVNKAVFLFFAISFVSVLSAILITQSVVPHIAILHFFRRVEYMIGIFIGYSVLKSQKDLSFFIKCILLVVVYTFIYGFGQKYANWPVITTQNYEYSKGVALRYMPGGHLVSTFAGHYDMASFLLLALPLLIALLLSNKEVIKQLNIAKSHLTSKVILTIVICCGMWLLVNTVSRISIAGYLLSGSLIILFIRKWKALPVFLLLSVLVIGLSTNLIDRYTRIFDVYIKKTLKLSLITPAFAQEEGVPKRLQSTTPAPQSIPIFEDRSTSIRLNVEWPRAIRAFSKNPLLGTGYSSITLATDNDYLRLLGEVGFLGFLAFILILFRVFISFIRFVPFSKHGTFEGVFILSMMAAVPAVLLNALFIDVFEASKFAIIFWLMIGFSLSVSKNFENE